MPNPEVGKPNKIWEIYSLYSALDSSQKIYSIRGLSIETYNYFGYKTWQESFGDEDKCYEIIADSLYGFLAFKSWTEYEYTNNYYKFRVYSPEHDYKWEIEEYNSEMFMSGNAIMSVLRDNLLKRWIFLNYSSGTYDSYFAGFFSIYDDSGELKKTRSIRNTIRENTISVDKQGNIYISSSEGSYLANIYPASLYCFSANADSIWCLNFGKNTWPVFPPILDDYFNPALIYATYTDTLYCVNGANGVILWKMGNIYLAPAIDTLGNLFLPFANELRKIDRTGRITYIKTFPGRIITPPVLDRSFNIYLATNDSIFSLNKELNRRWTHPINSGVKNLMLGENGHLFAITGSELICLRDETSISEYKAIKKIPPDKLICQPNPFSEYLHVTIPEEGKIYSLTGSLVLKLPSGKHIINTSDWNEGLYFLKSGNSTVKLIKFR